MVADYCFVKSNSDSSTITGLVIKVYPYKLFFGCIVQSKGPDPLVVSRLTQWIKNIGLVHFAYRSDEEPAIIAMIQEACARVGRRGVKVTEAEEENLQVPELTAEDCKEIDPRDLAAGTYYEEKMR